MNIKLNLLPIRVNGDNFSIYLSPIAQDLPRIKKQTISEILNINFDTVEDFLYWDIEKFEGSEFHSVKLEKRFFTQKLLNRALYKWLLQNNFIVERSFTKSFIVWSLIEDSNSLKKYKRYSLNVIFVDSLSKWSLQICYNGISYATYNPRHNIIEKQDVNRVIRNQKVFKLYNNDLEDNDEVVLNRFIVDKYKLKSPPFHYYDSNKYKTYYNEITAFINNDLKGKNILNIFEITSNELLETFPSNLGRIDKDLNLLEFGNKNLNYNIIDGLRIGGPVQLPKNINEIRFIYIFQKDDREYANTLHSYLKKGYRNYPGLELFTGIKYNLDIENSLKFTSEETCLDELNQLLNLMDKKNKYFAFFLTPTEKEFDYQRNFSIYPEVKKLLLEFNISSQAIEKQKINDNNFNFYLTNISIAIIAKNGGIPWTIPVKSTTELVIGIGAYKGRNKTIIGNAVCFDNGGRFYEFETFQDTQYDLLFLSFKKYIEDFIHQNKQFQRLIIHYYKQPGRAEKKAINVLLDKLNLSVPYYIVTINETESDDYVLFDSDFSGLMPVSGTYYKLRKNCFLLCNNSRYSISTRQKIQDYHFPIKIYISTNDTNVSLDQDVADILMNEVYQFSRMYWKSVKQQNLPVTVKYSNLIASIIARFSEQKLPDTVIAKQSLWFL